MCLCVAVAVVDLFRSGFSPVVTRAERGRAERGGVVVSHPKIENRKGLNKQIINVPLPLSALSQQQCLPYVPLYLLHSLTEHQNVKDALPK